MTASSPPDPGSVAWLPASPNLEADASLGPLQLAWLGDAVWELHQRLRHCRQAGQTALLHAAVVAEVRAEAQARALERLDPLLSPQERDWVRRGRNRAGRGPRGGDPGRYGQATGFETMVGWLFLRNPQRLAQLLAQLDSPEPAWTTDP